jgi:hypothetical protein
MNKLLWVLAVSTIPLLMIKEFRVASIPLTYLIILILGVIDFKQLISSKIGEIEKKIYLTVFIFIFIAFIDLTRSLNPSIDFFYEFKLILLLIVIKLYSHFMYKFGIKSFLKWIAISSGLVLIALLYRSLFIYNAPYFVINPEQITEAGKNQAAFYLALTIPLLIWFIRHFKLSLLLKILTAISLIIHLFSAIYVQSKGVLVAMIGSYLITSFFYSSKKIRIGSVAKIGILLLIPFYFIVTSEHIDLSKFETDIVELLNQDTTSSNSANERLEYSKYSWAFFVDNPVLGIGTNNFANITKKATHNNYLQILCENGFVGFIVFISFLYNTHKNLFKYKKLNPKPSYLLVINSFWSLTIYLVVINGFFNAITAVILAIIIYYEKTSLVQLPESIYDKS